MASAFMSLNPRNSLLSASVLSVTVRHSVLEVSEGAVRIDCWIKTFEGTVMDAGEVGLMLLCCCFQKIQHIKVELFLGYPDERAVHLKTHHVTDLVIVHQLVIAAVKLIISCPLELQRVLKKDIIGTVNTVLVNNSSLAERKKMLFKLRLVC
jgi:hypothetical protein